MIPVETIPGIGRGRDKGEWDGGCQFKYNMFDMLLRTFVNATIYPLPTQQLKFFSKSVLVRDSFTTHLNLTLFPSLSCLSSSQ
jgi:hypothetical protein